VEIDGGGGALSSRGLGTCQVQHATGGVLEEFVDGPAPDLQGPIRGMSNLFKTGSVHTL
jgi:hypothetical protein